jgi:hypothetical protein
VTVNSTGTLTLDNIPSHNHTVTLDSQGAHTHTGNTDEKGGHSHTITNASASTYNNYNNGAGAIPSSSGYAGYSYQFPGMSTAGAHTHGFTTASNGAHSHTATVGNAGKGTAFNATANNVSTMQPYITLNYIIKYDDASNITEPYENYQNKITYYLGVF